MSALRVVFGRDVPLSSWCLPTSNGTGLQNAVLVSPTGRAYVRPGNLSFCRLREDPLMPH